MRPLLFITALLLLVVLHRHASRSAIPEPPFTSADKRRAKVVQPVYPASALRAGVEGAVNLEVLVGKDGHVEKAKVMNGPTLLRQAALDAVKQWAWEPFLINSSPIRVRTRVTVRFDLHNRAASQE